MPIKGDRGFTLIELLIVVAIIAILAAIAVPNFLEAQTRSKVSRAKADMRSLVTATASYQVDYNKAPEPDSAFTTDAYDRLWWGFAPSILTSPVAYMTSIPIDIFPDETNRQLPAWINLDPQNNTIENAPYQLLIRVNSLAPGGPQDIIVLGNPNTGIEWPFLDPGTTQKIQSASFVYVTAGPDRAMNWQPGFGGAEAALYDPTNGTVSFGDIYQAN